MRHLYLLDIKYYFIIKFITLKYLLQIICKLIFNIKYYFIDKKRSLLLIQAKSIKFMLIFIEFFPLSDISLSRFARLCILLI